MANEIPNADLEALMEKVGVGERTKKKMREANKPAATTRGHGAPSFKTRIDLDDGRDEI